MATREAQKRITRQRRKKRIRKKVRGTADRPRLVVVRSLKHITASLVDDARGVTLFGVADSSLKDEAGSPKDKVEEGSKSDGESKDKKSKKARPMTAKVATAFRVGQAIADVAGKKGISRVVFDRNGFRYHGRIRAVAEGARKGGLSF